MLLIKSKAFSFFLCIIVILHFSCSCSCTFIIINNCPNTIWPGTLAGSGTPQLLSTGFRLDPRQNVKLGSVPGWSGRIWARTGCTFDEFGVGKCQTGDCGGKLECNGNGATPPTSLFEITLGKGNDKDFYDISMVDGYNLPLLATPRPSFGACNATGCISDVNMGCPKELQVVGEGGGNEGRGVIACKSACEAFGLDHYCCSGKFGNPTTCKPSYYSTIFKRACPTAYSYAYDDGTSTFTCNAYDYTIVFCPDVDGMKQPPTTLTPPIMPTPPTLQQPFTPPPVTQQPSTLTPPAPVVQEPATEEASALASYSTKLFPLQLLIIPLILSIIT